MVHGVTPFKLDHYSDQYGSYFVVEEPWMISKVKKQVQDAGTVCTGYLVGEITGWNEQVNLHF